MVVAVTTFSLAAALIVLVPGPDTLVVLRALIRGGRARAARAVAGVLCGQCVWVGAAAFGLSALLRASHAGYVALKIAGGAYLITLGVQSLRRRGTPHDETGGRGLLGTGFFGGMASEGGIGLLSAITFWVQTRVDANRCQMLIRGGTERTGENRSVCKSAWEACRQ